MIYRLASVVLALSFVFTTGCSQQEEATPTAPATPPQAAAPSPEAAPQVRELIPSAPVQQALPPGHPPTAGLPPAGGQPQVVVGNEGTTTAVHQAGGYTYLEVDRSGQRVWLASSPVTVKVGDRVQWGRAAVMRNFTSKALGRTFDELLFVSKVTPVVAAGAEPPVAQSNRAKVVSLTQSGGYSFLELERNGGRQWMAAQVAQVAVGDMVTWSGGMVMRNFSSRSLGRTFDEIIFVGAVGRAN